MILRELEKKDFIQASLLASYVWCNTYCRGGIRKIESEYVNSHFSPSNFISIVTSPSKKCLLAQEGDKIIALCIVDLESQFQDKNEFGSEITNLYVHPDCQGQHVGTKLLQGTFRCYGEKKWLTTWVHNTKAIEFYKKNGFVQIGYTNFDLYGELHENLVLAHK